MARVALIDRVNAHRYMKITTMDVGNIFTCRSGSEQLTLD